MGKCQVQVFAKVCTNRVDGKPLVLGIQPFGVAAEGSAPQVRKSAPYHEYLKLHKIGPMISALNAIVLVGTQAQAARSVGSGTIIAIVDSSGSMSQTDPRGLRLEALRMIVDSLGEGQRFGLIDFDDRVRVLAEAEPLGRLASPERERVREAVGQIDASGGTSIRGGLEQAARLTVDPTRTVWVLLTDGMDQHWRGESDGIVPPGVKVHSIAFSPQADRAGLARLSRDTGGISEAANSADDLHRIVGNLFGMAENDEVVLVRSGNIRPGEDIAYNVLLESGQQQTEFRITWPGSDVGLSLVDPRGKRISMEDALRNGYGAKAGTYGLIRVDNPAAGRWRVELKGLQVAPAGEAFNLRIAAKQSLVRANWASSAPVPEVGEPFSITLAASTDVRWEQAELTTWSSDGAPSSRSVKLGGIAALLGSGSAETVFSVTPRKPGDYRVQITAHGRTSKGEVIQRSLDRSYRVAEVGQGLRKKQQIDPFIRRSAQ